MVRPLRLTAAALLLAAAAGAEPLPVGECARLALARSPAARAAHFDVAAAQHRLRAARGAYLPQLSAQAQYGRSEGFDPAVTDGGSTALVLAVEQPLLDGGLRSAQFEAAVARLRGAAAIEQQHRADVVLAVRTAYFAALAAAAEMRIQAAALAALREALDLLRRQEQGGVVPHNDVLRVQLARHSVTSARRAAAATRDAACRELSVLTGVEVAPASLTNAGELAPVVATPAVIDDSPVLSDARAQAAAARQDAAAARSEGRPHLTLSASAGSLGIRPEDAFHKDGGGQFLLGFSVPLFDGGATPARTAAAFEAASAAAAAIELARQTLLIELDGAAIEARRAQADLAAWKDAVPVAEEHVQLMRARYFGGGNVRVLEVLDALTQTIEVRLAAARARLAYSLALATQRNLLGDATP